MPSHASLTGADLHEPKGVASASNNTVYVANGSGSGTWEKIDADAINTSSIKNLNKVYIYHSLQGVQVAQTAHIPIPFNCTLTGFRGALAGTITGGNNTVTFTNNGVSTIASFTVATTDASGTMYTSGVLNNSALVAGSYLRIVVSASASGGSANLGLVLEFSLS